MGVYGFFIGGSLTSKHYHQLSQPPQDDPRGHHQRNGGKFESELVEFLFNPINVDLKSPQMQEILKHRQKVAKPLEKCQRIWKSGNKKDALVFVKSTLETLPSRSRERLPLGMAFGQMLAELGR